MPVNQEQRTNFNLANMYTSVIPGPGNSFGFGVCLGFFNNSFGFAEGRFLQSSLVLVTLAFYRLVM